MNIHENSLDPLRRFAIAITKGATSGGACREANHDDAARRSAAQRGTRSGERLKSSTLALTGGRVRGSARVCVCVCAWVSARRESEWRCGRVRRVARALRGTKLRVSLAELRNQLAGIAHVPLCKSVVVKCVVDDDGLETRLKERKNFGVLRQFALTLSTPRATSCGAQPRVAVRSKVRSGVFGGLGRARRAGREGSIRAEGRRDHEQEHRAR
jgi:hypothetical protein